MIRATVISLLLFLLLLPGRGFGEDLGNKEILQILKAVNENFPGLEEVVNTTGHSYFLWTWDRHTVSVMNRKYPIVFLLNKCKESASPGRSEITYVFIDSDLDGQVDIAYRKLYIFDKDGGLVLWLEPDESLEKVMMQWSFNIPNAQEMYQNELKYWYYRLIYADEEMN